jgi:hypothetical protein
LRERLGQLEVGVDVQRLCQRSIKLADSDNRSLKVPPTVNYGSAIARAVEWLGDRYLLAKPINAAARSHGGTNRDSAVSLQSPRRPRLWQADPHRSSLPLAVGEPDAVRVATSVNMRHET